MIRYILLACLSIFAMCSQAAGIDVKTYIPQKASLYAPTVVSEVFRLMPTFPDPEYFCSLIEQESCIHLTHKRCWDPSSELKTSREYGIGLGLFSGATYGFG